MHLIIVRRDLATIIHRHPPIASDGTISDTITFTKPGPYRVVVDAYPDVSGPQRNFQLFDRLRVAGSYHPQKLPPFSASQTVAGYRFTLLGRPNLHAIQAAFLKFTVRDPQGRPMRFTPWYGALAHAIFFRQGSLDYFHTHVCAPGATGCTSVLGGTTVTGSSTTPGKLTVGVLVQPRARGGSSSSPAPADASSRRPSRSRSSHNKESQMPTMNRSRLVIVTLAATAALVFTSTAWAHARVSPPVGLAKVLSVYTLAVPTEKSGTTTQIEFTPPSGFSIDSFVPSPGWKRTVAQSGSGEEAVVTKVTWSGGHVPTGEDAAFSFLAQPSEAKTYTFGVRQTYSDGSVVDWSGPESSDDPAPTIEAKSSFGGSSSSTLAIIALVVGAIGVVLAAVALFAGGRRAIS